MAPFVVPGSKGVNMSRNGSQIRSYKAPLMRPKRTIEASDIERRGFWGRYLQHSHPGRTCSRIARL